MQPCIMISENSGECCNRFAIMYEQVSHATLNRILDELKPEIRKQDLRFFYSRLGANFYAIYSLFESLYGNREDFYPQIKNLVEVMAKNYINRPQSLKIDDREKEDNHEWFLHQKWVGMALYANGFAEDLKDLSSKIAYFSELGVNVVHILPILECPTKKSDGGYAVSNFRKVDSRLGDNSQLINIIEKLHKQDSLIALDIVINHTSDEHEWAKRAARGEEKYQDYYYTFKNRDIPDMFEYSMPDVFPETDPGNFTWSEEMQKWVMTVFNHFQWDLNYSNPSVFIEMLDIIFYWANLGVDIVRMDAVAFLWKRIGTASQNEHEAHLVLQLFKDCCQVVAPGLLFIAEAIVAPSEIVKYFGEDAIVAKECEIAYNATYMALLWETVATKNSKLLYQGLKSLPGKLDRATWLNYLRCHDDIGFGFNDYDIAASGYDPMHHRRFLLDYFTGEFNSSVARGLPFAQNAKTGDARVSGSLASLVGLEAALKKDDRKLIDTICDHILMLHSLIMSFGGIPLLYYGDEIATLNNYQFEKDPEKSSDSRWIHRPTIDWEKSELRHHAGAVEYRIFTGLKKMIAIRKETDAFADFNNRELVDMSNTALFSFVRYNYVNPTDKVLVIANLSGQPQRLPLSELTDGAYFNPDDLEDLWTGLKPTIISRDLIFSAHQFYWLKLSQRDAMKT